MKTIFHRKYFSISDGKKFHHKYTLFVINIFIINNTSFILILNIYNKNILIINNLSIYDEKYFFINNKHILNKNISSSKFEKNKKFKNYSLFMIKILHHK